MAFKMKKFGEIKVDRAPLDSGVLAEARNDGTIVIDGPAGRLPEGHEDHPWEAEAIAAETENNNKKEDYGV